MIFPNIITYLDRLTTIFFVTYADLIEFPWILDLFFFYFWPPFLITTFFKFKFEFQISRVSKIINILFFWSIFCPP